MRSSLASIVVLLLTLWAVSGGDENKKAVPTSAVTSKDLQRLKSVINKGLESKDPLLTSYSVLGSTTLKIDVANPAVSTNIDLLLYFIHAFIICRK